MKKTLFILSFLAFTCSLFAQDGIDFIKNQNWEEVLTKAKKEEKIIFIDGYTVWCGPCKKMDKQVFPLKEVGEVYNAKFINAKYDMEKGEGLKIAKKYSVRAYPTFLFIDGDGKLLHRIAGFIDPAKMVELANTAVDPTQQLLGMMKRYQSGERSPAFLYAYAYARQKAADKSHTKIADAYLETQKDWTTDKNKKFVYDFVESADSKTFAFLVKHQDNYGEVVPKAKVKGKIQDLMNVRIEQLFMLKDEKMVLKQAKALYDLVEPNLADAKVESFKMQYYRSKGNREGYAKAAVAYVEKMDNKINAGELNDIAWTFNRVIKDKEMLKMALGWSKQALKMEKDAMFYETIASLYQKLGKKGKMKKMAKKGLKLAKVNGDETKAFEDLLR